MATQTPEGYIGNYAPESRLKAWDIWGRKYVMLGLISYYDISNDKKALNAAAKEADFLIKELNDKNALIVKMGNHRGMAASSVLEPICQLYTRTGNKKYLDFVDGVSACSLGHQHPRVNQAIIDQLNKYSHVMVYGEYAQHPAVEYCKLLVENMHSSLNKVYLVNSGTEAIEGALKLQREGFPTVFAFEVAGHGGPPDG